MVMRLIRFEKCIARPDNADGSKNMLTDHLVATAFGWGDPSSQTLTSLNFLGGLLHDAGKARWRWQRYIGDRQSGGRSFPSVNHAPLGSAVFMYAASKLVATWDLRREELWEARRQILRISRDIYDHHGELGDIEGEPPWAATLTSDHVAECDMGGLFHFVNSYFPGLKLDGAEFTQWLSRAPEIWETWAAKCESRFRAELTRKVSRFSVAASHCVRIPTSGLIASDRLDAAGILPGADLISPEMAAEAESRLLDYCSARAESFSGQKGPRKLTSLRQMVQDECVRRFVDSSSAHMYTLVLPTGLGKTLTSLRVALKACQSGMCSRIIYVAPYLSILSQATREVRHATGLEVLEHHHLSAISVIGAENEGLKDCLPTGNDDTTMLDSWLAPVVTTTFNQFFRALFPERAQHTMRLQALHGAFVIIDEPQVIDRSAWTLFLTMTEAMIKQANAKLLFSTATLPPLQPGLSSDPVILAPPYLEVESRYEVDVLEWPLGEDEVAQMAAEAVGDAGSVAVIMNTVGDAYEVYNRVRGLLPKEVCFLLTGAMTAPHKAKRIDEIKAALKQGRPVLAICTQILECGVDLSFARMFRAAPVLPSIVQAAGRVNRHAELGIGRITVFRFLRGGEDDTRRYVYRSGPVREATDVCLAAYPAWGEQQSSEVLNEYHSQVMARSTATESLEALVEAACGRWSAFGRVDPFDGDYPHVSVFVPFGEDLLDSHVMSLLQRYAPMGLDQLYDRYLDRGFRSNLSFRERKEFMALMQHFIVPLDEKSAHGRVAIDPERPIAILADRRDYCAETGFAHLKCEGNTTSRIMI
jgi:CRISPR-associated endonuclease/helicase Cas3